MSFGWSFGDVIAGLELLNKIRVALKDSGGSKLDYQDETAFLDNLSSTLRSLSSIQPGTMQPGVAESISRHVARVKESVEPFLNDLQSQFGPDLGHFPTTRRGFLGAPKASMRKVQWALSTSKKVRALRDRVSAELVSLQVAMSHHIINICTQMPDDIRGRMESVMKSTLHGIHGASGFLPPDENKSSAAKNEDLTHIFRVLGNLQDRESETMVEGNHINVYLQSRTDMANKAKNRQIDSDFNKISKVLNRLERLHGDFEAYSPTRYPTAPSNSIHPVHQTRQSLVDLETPGLNLQAVDELLERGSRVLRTLIHFIAFTIITGYSKIVVPLFSRIVLVRIGTSSANGLRLIDALGRIYMLPYGRDQTLRTVNRTLEIWFEDCPGQDLVREGLYCLGDPRKPNELFTEESWSHLVQRCSAVKMWMVLDKCQACGSRMTLNMKGATQTVVW